MVAVEWNLAAAWVGILLGTVSGAAIGVFFAREGWLGGYGSWARRMLRLGHIAFFGTAFLNLAYVVSSGRLGHGAVEWSGDMTGTARMWAVAGALLLVGTVGMPLVCFLSAWRKGWRALFPIPAASLMGAAAIGAALSLHALEGGAS